MVRGYCYGAVGRGAGLRTICQRSGTHLAVSPALNERVGLLPSIENHAQSGKRNRFTPLVVLHSDSRMRRGLQG
jgi:hypothetical protein